MQTPGGLSRQNIAHKLKVAGRRPHGSAQCENTKCCLNHVFKRNSQRGHEWRLAGDIVEAVIAHDANVLRNANTGLTEGFHKSQCPHVCVRQHGIARQTAIQKYFRGVPAGVLALLFSGKKQQVRIEGQSMISQASAITLDPESAPWFAGTCKGNPPIARSDQEGNGAADSTNRIMIYGEAANIWSRLPEGHYRRLTGRDQFPQHMTRFFAMVEEHDVFGAEIIQA